MFPLGVGDFWRGQNKRVIYPMSFMPHQDQLETSYVVLR